MRIKMLLALGCFIGALVGCGGFRSSSSAGGSGGQSVTPPPSGPCKTQLTVSWTAPTTNTDGSPLTNLAGFNIFYGLKVNGGVNYVNQINIPNKATSSYVISNLQPNTYYFVMTAYNTYGAESVPSNTVSGTIQQCTAMNMYFNLSTGGATASYVTRP